MKGMLSRILAIMRRWSAVAVAALLVLLLALAPSRGMAGTAPLRIAAASDLQFALPEIAAAFMAESGIATRLSFGSSGNLMRQIMAGAPFDIFLSADEAYAAALVEAGAAQGPGVLYAAGRLVLLLPKDSPLRLDPTLGDLRAALADGRLERFAIANPAHAPYGMRARDVLRRAGLWEAIVPHLVYGENVSQAAQFALSDAAEGGIVALSLARAPAIGARARYVLLPAAWHRPLLQRAVMTAAAPPAAARFLHFLTAPAARRILARHGFTPPQEGS